MKKIILIFLGAISSLLLSSCVRGIQVDMIFVSPETNKNDTVPLRSFYIGRCQITEEEWKSVMKHNTSGFKHMRAPVLGATLEEIEAFILTLNEISCERYRMPTREEWIYATRTGMVDTLYNKPNSLGFRIAKDT